MQKRTKSKSHLLDAVVVILCLFVSAGGLYLFWKDLNSSSFRSDKPSVGTISFKYKIAQRKFEDRVVWERLSQNSPLYNGDVVRTADLASAVITFADGTELDLFENTMIQIFYDEATGLQIEVNGGDIQVDSSDSSGVSVRLDNGSVVNVGAGSSLAAKSDPSGAHNIEVKGGEVSLTTESGESAQLSYGESVSIEGSGEIVRNPITVTSISRDTRVLNMEGEETPVTIAWTTNDDAGGDSEVIVETSRSRDFSSIESAAVVDAASSYTLDTSDGGVLYWRVYTKDSADKPAEGKITVETISAAALVSPVLDAEFGYRTSLPRIAFRWEGNDYADYYRLSVSATPDMRSPEVSLDVRDTFASVDTLPAGVWYWQVTPYYTLNGMGFSGESEVRPFRIVQNERIPPPQLSVPAEGAQLVYRESLSATFMWKSDIKGASYELQISADEDFGTVVYSEKTELLRVQHDFLPSELGDGAWWWRIVRSSDEADDTEPVSEARSFTVARYVPQETKLLYPPEDYSTEKAALGTVQFMWKLGDDYSSASARSVVQFSKSPSFSPVAAEQETDGLSLSSVDLDEGTWWWRVGVRNGTGEVQGATPPRALTVLKELSAPQILSPSLGAEILASQSAQVTVRWASVSGADYYTVRIYGKDDVPVAQNDGVYGSEAYFTLAEGTYTCRVQAVAAQSGTAPLRVSAASSAPFSVRIPTPVSLSLPADGERVAGLTALRQPVVFSWDAGSDRAPSYDFILTRRNADGTQRVVERRTVTGTSVSVPRLTEGSYTWRVEASLSGGVPVNSGTRQLSVLAVPPLQRASLSAPAQNLVMDAAYLRANRSIAFSWNRVPGATAYSFVLYQRSPDGTLKVIMSERNMAGTEVRLRDLSVLDVGSFVWQVTAFAYASDGFEEQRSEASTGNFRIDFDAPQQVETVDPGRLYGE